MKDREEEEDERCKNELVKLFSEEDEVHYYLSINARIRMQKPLFTVHVGNSFSLIRQ